MTARDLAATVRGGLALDSGYEDSLAALAGLEKQAEDAQAEVDLLRGSVGRVHERAVRAEEALRQSEESREVLRGGLANVLASAGVPQYVRENVEHYLALAAAGADTP